MIELRSVAKDIYVLSIDGTEYKDITLQEAMQIIENMEEDNED